MKQHVGSISMHCISSLQRVCVLIVVSPPNPHLLSVSGLDASPPASTHELTIPNDVSINKCTIHTRYTSPVQQQLSKVRFRQEKLQRKSLYYYLLTAHNYQSLSRYISSLLQLQLCEDHTYQKQPSVTTTVHFLLFIYHIQE